MGYSKKVLASIVLLFTLVTLNCLDSYFLKRKVHKILKFTKAGTCAEFAGRLELPKVFHDIPHADDQGILLSTKRLRINGMAHPYNACILEKQDGSGYYVFFRYDIKKTDVEKFSYYALETYVGVAELDPFFQHKEHSFRIIDTGTCTAEDPRAVYCNGKMYLIYNDLVSIRPYSRSMRVAEVDPSTWKLSFQTDLNMQLAVVEKNWPPFVYDDKIHFVYNISPSKIFRLEDPMTNQLVATSLPKLPRFLTKEWEDKWGVIRGGTPARLVDGQYLAFFHSRREEKHAHWYTMGAYTFEAHPPFRVTAISRNPILFSGLFDSPPEHTSNPKVKVIFPAGFAIESSHGIDLIHVSVGENDNATKILTFDKQKLFESLRPITDPESPQDALVHGIPHW